MTYFGFANGVGDKRLERSVLPYIVATALCLSEQFLDALHPREESHAPRFLGIHVDLVNLSHDSPCNLVELLRLLSFKLLPRMENPSIVGVQYFIPIHQYFIELSGKELTIVSARCRRDPTGTSKRIVAAVFG